MFGRPGGLAHHPAVGGDDRLDRPGLPVFGEDQNLIALAVEAHRPAVEPGHEDHSAADRLGGRVKLAAAVSGELDGHGIRMVGHFE